MSVFSGLPGLRYWMTEREQIRTLKELGSPKPWTDDNYLRYNRFCNVRRMDDSVSQWLLNRWYDPLGTAPDLLVAACLARLVNWPDTLAELEPVWNAATAQRRLQKRFSTGVKTFSGVYKVITNTEGTKIEQIVRHVDAVAKAGNIVDPLSLRNTWERLKQFQGFGSFLAGQVVADLRHTLCMWPRDAMSWAPIGPGSRRGMRRLLGLEAKGPMTQDEFDRHMAVLMRAPFIAEFRTYDGNALEAMDVQNCLCELDKYLRLKRGEGSARNLYNGG
jgi:hypothetical protein